MAEPGSGKISGRFNREGTVSSQAGYLTRGPNMDVLGKYATAAWRPLVVVLLFCCSGVADHLPENQIAKGKADEVLSSVNVYKTTMGQIFSRLGPPSRTIDVLEDRNIAGGRDYEWDRGEVKIFMGTWNDKGTSSVPYSVEVWGKRPAGILGITGRGLRLGDKLSKVRQIYGHRFGRYQQDDGTLQVTIQWQNETTLYLYFDHSGKVDHIHLMAATE
jgi:hypothetical protein